MAGLSNPYIVINNVSVGVLPNTFSYTEGLGEANYRVQSSGGQNVDTVYTLNIETALSMIKFTLISSTENVNLARAWKANQDGNVITASQDTFTRTFRRAALITDYEVIVTADGTIALEFKSLPAV
jgi:dihydroxyacetone kinase-like predicted kinase